MFVWYKLLFYVGGYKLILNKCNYVLENIIKFVNFGFLSECLIVFICKLYF